jgi:hypothetical protein
LTEIVRLFTVTVEHMAGLENECKMNVNFWQHGTS